ncbi:MAG: amino acid ABC transporter substrate-binding protein [Actinomycetota bacterium]
MIGIRLAVAALALAAAGSAAAAEATLAKAARTGEFVMGVRERSYPLSYLDAAGAPIGYHVDVCRRIFEVVKARLNKPALQLRTQVVTSQSRIPALVKGEIDIECGSTTNTAARQQEVAFAPTTFVTSVRVAVRRDAKVDSLAQLDGKPVVTTAGSTSVQLLQARQHGRSFRIEKLYGNDHAESFRMLEDGRAVAFAMDDNLLAGLIAYSADPGRFRILDDVLSVEPIAIMVRKDDPEFKAVVDGTIREMMAKGDMATLYDKWFRSPIPPRQINLNVAMSGLLANLLRFPSDEPVENFRATE